MTGAPGVTRSHRSQEDRKAEAQAPENPPIRKTPGDGTRTALPRRAAPPRLPARRQAAEATEASRKLTEDGVICDNSPNRCTLASALALGLQIFVNFSWLGKVN